MSRRFSLILVLLCGCSSDGGSTFVTWPEVGPDTLSFVILSGGKQEILGPFDQNGPTEPIERADSSAVIIELERAWMAAVHPSVDRSALEDSQLVAPAAACVGCEEACLSSDGARVEAALTEGRLWARDEGGAFELQAPELPTSLGVSLKVAALCEASSAPPARSAARLEPDGIWNGTLRVASEGTWVWGPDLVLLAEDGTRWPLSEQVEIRGVSALVADGRGAYWVAAFDPPGILRVASRSVGLSVDRQFLLTESWPLAVASTPSGGFVATGGKGSVWTSSTGDSIRHETVGGDNGLWSIIPNPTIQGEYIIGGGFGFALFGDPFAGAASFRTERITAVDRPLNHLAVRAGPDGPEIWASSALGLYLRRGEDDWELSEAVAKPRADTCTLSPHCGFETIALQVQGLDARDRQLLISTEACPAVLLVDPELGCATRLDLPPGFGEVRGPSFAPDLALVVRGQELFEIDLPPSAE